MNLLTSRRCDLSYSSEIMWTLYDFIASGFLVAVALAGLGMLTLVFV